MPTTLTGGRALEGGRRVVRLGMVRPEEGKWNPVRGASGGPARRATCWTVNKRSVRSSLLWIVIGSRDGEVMTAREAVAAVTVPAPHGPDVVAISDGETVTFGRAASCEVRFAFAPTADEGVPRVAGRLIVAGGRVIIESLPGEGRRSIEVAADGQPVRMLAVGEAYSPVFGEFKVTVHGEQRAWPLLVAARMPAVVPPSDDDRSTRRFNVVLTPMQERVLRAYVEPMRRGRLEPATHREAAEALNYHPNSVREALYEVWMRLFAAGVPMPDVNDKRVAVAEAVRLHRLLEDSVD